MNRLLRIVVALASVAGLALAVSRASAQGAGTAQVHVTPASIQLAAGQTAQAAVEVDNVQGLYGVDITLTFDPHVVEVVAPAAQGTFLDSGLTVKNEADNSTGTVRFAMTQMNPSEPRSGSGVLLVLTLRGRQAGATSALTLAKVDLAQRDGFMISDTLTSGQVVVVATPGNAPTASPFPTQAATAAQAGAAPAAMQLAATPTSPPTASPATQTPLSTSTTATSAAAPARTPFPSATPPPATQAATGATVAPPRPGSAVAATAAMPGPATTAPTATAAASGAKQPVAAAVSSTALPPTSAPTAVVSAPTAAPAQEVAAVQPAKQPAPAAAPQSAQTQLVNPFQPLGLVLGLCGVGFVVLGIGIAMLFAVAGRIGTPAGQSRSD